MKKSLGVLLVIIQVLCLMYFIIAEGPLTSYWYSNSLILLSIIIAGWAFLTMGLTRFSVFPMPKDNTNLITKGPYGYVRHPMYTSLLVFGLGYILANPSSLPILVYATLFIVLYVKSSLEEQLLGQRFQSYKSYKKETKRFIPFIF